MKISPSHPSIVLYSAVGVALFGLNVSDNVAVELLT